MTTRTISTDLRGRVGRAGDRTRTLPVRRDLTLLYAGALLVALLVVAVAGTFLVIGSLLLVFFFGLDNASLFLNAFYVTLLSLFLTALAAPLFDDQRRHTDAPTNL